MFNKWGYLEEWARLGLPARALKHLRTSIKEKQNCTVVKMAKTDVIEEQLQERKWDLSMELGLLPNTTWNW